MTAKTEMAMMMYMCGYRAVSTVGGRSVPDGCRQPGSDERAVAPAG